MGKYVTKTSTAVKNRYKSKTYEQINLLVKKGQKSVIADHAKSLGKSLNAYINDIIEKDIGQEMNVVAHARAATKEPLEQPKQPFNQGIVDFHD